VHHGASLQVEFMSAKALAADMYIDELESKISDAATMMLDDGCHGAQSQQLADWLNAVAERAAYAHRRRVHVQVAFSALIKKCCC